MLTVQMNFGFLVFGVTDYASKLSTAHYRRGHRPRATRGGRAGGV